MSGVNRKGQATQVFLLLCIVFVQGQNVDFEPNLGSGTTAVAAESSNFLPEVHRILPFPSTE